MIVLEHFFSSFGLIAYLLVLASVVIVALSIERLITVYLQPKLPLKLLQIIINNIKHGELEQANLETVKTPQLYQSWIKIILNSTQKQAEDELSLNLLELVC